MPQIILATSSPYRQEAFRFLGLDFVAQGSEVDEYFDGRPDSPGDLVQHLAKLKAESVAKKFDAGIVVGFDSVGWFNGQILEKPKSREEALQRLKSLSGNTHQFYTGIYMINLETGKNISNLVATNAEVRKLTDDDINKYLDQDPKYNTYALGYDPLGHYSSTFVRKIDGSYNNLTRGIPLEAIVEMLFDIGYKL
jgi:septum formation protein